MPEKKTISDLITYLEGVGKRSDEDSKMLKDQTDFSFIVDLGITDNQLYKIGTVCAAEAIKVASETLIEMLKEEYL